MMNAPHILAIDTSCDETAVAVAAGRKILANAIASQINIHKKYGGVVPFLAKRAHQEKINYVYKEALTRAAVSEEQIDAVAATIGPGLAPALEIGLDFGKKLARKLKKPLMAINHMEGHLLSPFALNKKGNGPLKKYTQKNFPLLGLLVSGKHTELVFTKKIGNYKLLGQTLDDGAGEAFDKFGRMLKLGYPGGPIVEEMAKKGNPNTINLPIPMQHTKNLNMSFSGLKTAALYTIQKRKNITKTYTYNICASFQKAVALSLVTKLVKAIDQCEPKGILLGGGVISNLYIRRQIRKAVNPYGLPIYLPYSKKLFTDNAAMIAIPGYFKYLKKEFVTNLSACQRLPSLSFLP